MTVFDEMVKAISELGILSRSAIQGEPVAGGKTVTLVLTGSVGLLSPNDTLASLAGPGDVTGLEAMAGVEPPLAGRWLTAGRMLQVSASALLVENNHVSRLRWLAVTAAARQTALARETACTLGHGVTARLANLLSMLTDNGRLTVVPITQYELAELLGVQRTTICAATEQLKTLGVSKVTRGRVEIRDFAQLRATACGCRSHKSFEGQEHDGWFSADRCTPHHRPVNA